MYSLLFAARAGSWDELDVSSFEYDRFLEHTQEVIKTRFLPLTDQAVAALIGMPVLFAYEFKRDASPDPADEELAAARVGRLVSISRLQRGVEFRYEFDPEISSITTAGCGHLHTSSTSTLVATRTTVRIGLSKTSTFWRCCERKD
jgi:hypothetical protein